ncbi:hypothetical protein ACVIHI_002710 [Bradyrhizobium sp. USDA 4524]|uniref:hypothetical protein n=1 Tax=unclassified Bradyrhizobium TaxID=2631580 RepID=UPI00209DB8DE|nr:MULTISPECIES: hypothetical protein [unclassified Bradyrhizobium]MCP1844369.1 hypothetical protein [Bradyrhizobium sp. USDA 4538]MCP1904935.1 hypothetical protein [Bradyrhizobium sp. USDA 4537]MCP1989409.1 hypothetical protein [Bradyrhizobium sp. USDA 4539]
MMSKLWSGKGAALAAAGAAGAVLVAYLSLTLASPEPVSNAALGPEWQCSRVAFVLTTCTRRTEAEAEAEAEAKPQGEVRAIPVRAKDDCPPEL